MALPVLPVKPLPSLAGEQNGRLDPALLGPAYIPGGNFLLHKKAARAMRAMVHALGQAGFKVRATGTYRTFDAQKALFVSRYQPVSRTAYYLTPSSRRKYWSDAGRYGYSSPYWTLRRYPNGSFPAMAATPGTSNHGWGLAADLAEERDGYPGVESVSPAMVAWLCAHAHRFGYSAEAQSEPWHWRYVAGPTLPPAVIAFEDSLKD